MAISLLYQLGEGASEETLKAETGAVGRLALGTSPSPMTALPCGTPLPCCSLLHFLETHYSVVGWLAMLAGGIRCWASFVSITGVACHGSPSPYIS